MQERYADVIVDISSEKLDRVFQYRIPERMEGMLEPGTVVEVPFGKGNRPVRGYVTGISGQAGYDPARMKEIGRVMTDAADEEARLVGLAAWIRNRYGSTMLQALKTVIPVKRKIKEKQRRWIVLALDGDAARERLDFFQRKHQKARARLVEALLDEPELPWELVSEKLNITAAVIRALEEQGIVRVKSEKLYRNPVQGYTGEKKEIRLNEEQQRIVDEITGEWEEDPPGRYLIHGITGSGKTEVYMELIRYAVSRGQQAIVLIPEIALTYQTVLRFYRNFGDRVSVINSRLSQGERYDQFERARNGELDVMIGPRSALFTPFSRLGIIVMDEEHEPAYQSETMPRYHAREVALQRGKMEHARVVLGSATPSLEAYYGAMTGKYRLFRLTRRAGQAELPSVSVVDLRQELREGNRSMLSRSLREAIEERLSSGEQVMLFLNRRGYAGFVSCRSCGHVLTCPHCAVSLSLHRGGKLVCHYCGYEQPAVKNCPRCGSGFIRTFRAGTQQVEEELQREFPRARVLRMDLDTTRGKEDHQKILSAFAGREADILVGTQMIVKGHDFPDVTLVGALAADLSLHIPDYRAAERTFQLLTQAAGRAGRGKSRGLVIIQTYDPDHYAVQAAAAQDYESFYEQEMNYRALAGYPPAGGLFAIHCSGPDEAYLKLACGYLKKFIQQAGAGRGITVLGPADEAVSRIQDQYRMVIYLKHENIGMLTEIKNRIERYVAVNHGFDQVAMQFDIN
ncbi:MAG TPA: primosomal protein N' [Candidatus Merdiplasma excrementigallinarum]|uniref:Replication restart protein PriA n=1 Tax=Candidatus Merdiplasma excrementigallinarum TaxID=2840864 RepID=A0A9D1NZG7_9FIRM|nr:primosomal protein N' [Candidatus Merdiplasma excrementigallinarum]